ncbi:TPA: 50S ribosomal protein L17 [Candidatus Marinimicrobia bacterium]|nr:MAG: 50S ribosomal protein L17 [Marinimicrobia bacterium 46_47]KUK91846.1 MAG: 50S ribosomal protein L17 [Marinimicrobia bacterium 46_43]HAE88116.1 50S ribosomal protein L17 [Candidatus Neomarinimicrobiota bacterium]HBY18252.1 50S ribosomal protein L17 [Candidatus Neomarinimicrobiota bacterium]
MRHVKRGRKLGRTPSHRKAMLQNMAASLILHKQIKTTEAKAKEARRLVERLITYAKKDTTHYRRLAFAQLRNKEAVKILFEEIAPVYMNRNGGYTRILKLGQRPNDAAKVVLFQLVDMVGSDTDKKKKSPKKAIATKKEKAKESSKETPKTKKSRDEKNEPEKTEPVVKEAEALEETPVEDKAENDDTSSGEDTKSKA